MEIKLPNYLDADQVEVWNKVADSNDIKHLDIYIGHYDGSRFAGAGRLMMFLRKCKQKKIVIHVLLGEELPELTIQTATKLTNNANINRLFNTTAGIVIMHFTNAIYGPSREKDFLPFLRRLHYDNLWDNSSKLERGNETSIIFTSKNLIDVPPPPTVFTKTGWAARMAQEDLLAIISEKLGKDALEISDKLIDEFIKEAIDNVLTHAQTDLYGRAINELQFFGINRVNITDYSNNTIVGVPSISKISSSTKPTPLNKYLQLLQKKIQWRSELFLYEITVADCGIGIAQRLGADLNIYTGPIENETHYLLEAMKPYKSSKRSANPGVGMGLKFMMGEAKRLNALILFRSGRKFMFKNFLEIEQTDELKLFDWDDTTLNYLPGTSITMIFPKPENGKY